MAMANMTTVGYPSEACKLFTNGLVHNAQADGAMLREVIQCFYEMAVEMGNLLLAPKLRQRGYEGADLVHNLLADPLAAGAAASKFDPRRGSAKAFLHTLLRGAGGRVTRIEARHHPAGKALPERAAGSPGPAKQAADGERLVRVAIAVNGLPAPLRQEVRRRFPGLSGYAGTAAPMPGDGPEKPDGEKKEAGNRPNYTQRTRLWKKALEQMRVDLADFGECLF